MVPHLRADAGARVGGEDDVGGLVGQVTVDALARQRAAAARKEAAALDLMTGEATRGEVSGVALREMDVMTSRARHV